MEEKHFPMPSGATFGNVFAKNFAPGFRSIGGPSGTHHIYKNSGGDRSMIRDWTTAALSASGRYSTESHAPYTEGAY